MGCCLEKLPENCFQCSHIVKPGYDYAPYCNLDSLIVSDFRSPICCPLLKDEKMGEKKNV